MNNRRTTIVLISLAIILILAALGRLCIGSWEIGWPTGELAKDYLAERSSRLVLAVIVGVALSTSGVALQALLRNPLAEPFILGLSTGAAAGIMAQRWLFYQFAIIFSASYIGAALGAAVTMLIVFLASRRRGIIDPLGLLLTGVVLSTLNGAIVLAMNYLAGPGGIRDDLMQWMMGYLNQNVSHLTVITLGLLTALSLTILLFMGRAMDVTTLSASEAQSLGVNLKWMRTMLFVISALLAAGAVVLAGPVAFVGLICPHIARALLGPRHTTLLLGSALAGAILIVLADTAGALIAIWRNVGVMPLGIFTAILGGPVFLWMLHPTLGRGSE